MVRRKGSSEKVEFNSESRPIKQKEIVMSNIKIRKPTTWLLVAVAGIFSLATVACAEIKTEDQVDGNTDTPAIGAPAHVIGNVGESSTQSFPAGNSEIAASGSGVPAIEAYPVSSGQDYGYSQSYNPQVGATNSGIWVTGQSTMEIPADIAQVSIGVESRETTVAEARQSAAEVMESVLNAIKEHGVSEDDIVTTNFNIYPQTVWIEVSDSLGRHSEPRITGYTVTNTVQVTVHDIDNLSPVIDNAATAGGDLIRINSIQFTVDDSSVFGEQIRQQAAADALVKADIYARAMGVTLGQLIYLTEIGSSVPMARSNDMMMESAAMDGGFKSSPISVGDVNLSVTVQAVFAIAG
tara:strand:+ start:2683 stop:3738 length:1056 start_codon:yes stop_codon:yes gene_type:complete